MGPRVVALILLLCTAVFGIFRLLIVFQKHTWRPAHLVSTITPLMHPKIGCLETSRNYSTLEPSEYQLICDALTPSASVLSWGGDPLIPFFAQFVQRWYVVDSLRDNLSPVPSNVAVVNVNSQDISDVNYITAASHFQSKFDTVLVLHRCPDCALTASSLLSSPNSHMIVSGWAQYSPRQQSCFHTKQIMWNYAAVFPLREYALRIIVLTWRRFSSLQRLLNSLNGAKYGSHRLLLEIHVDGKKIEDDPNWDQTVAVAKAFKFINGPTTVRVGTTNHGLAEAWFSAWYPELDCPLKTIILEDDLELSPLWFQWLHRMWICYGDRVDLGGITLQKQQIRATDGKVVEIVNKGPFLYKLVGSWGFSPNPIFWREFLNWKRNLSADFVPKVSGLVMTSWHKTVKRGSMWTLWWIYFCEQKGLFTLYANAPNRRTLGGNHREVGEHYNSIPKIDFPLVLEWPEAWNTCPRALSKYSWDIRLTS